MISKSTIDHVYEIPIETVIAKYAELKKNGVNYKSCCPFHDEKTPSFVVSPAKGIYKCFGCGKGGANGVSFIMEKEGIDWIESIKLLANKHNILIEHDDSEDAQKYKTKIDRAQKLSEINTWAKDIYKENLISAPSIAIRCKSETADLFDIGFAPKSWDFLMNKAILKGIPVEILAELDLVRKSKNIYDTFRERIVFPIYNDKNMLVAFSGRDIGSDKETAKYLNTGETPLFIKGNELFGIHIAKQPIRKIGYAYIVEGNWDVVAMHEIGLSNTVAPCGTSLTINQLKLLSKFAKHIVFIYDGDAAGKTALLKNTRIAVENGFTVECVILFNGDDPDTWLRNENTIKEIGEKSAIEWMKEKHVDAIINIATEKSKSIKNVKERSEFLAYISETLSFIESDNIIVDYVRQIAKPCGLDIKELRRESMRKREEREQLSINEDKLPLPKSVNREEFEKHGFYEMVDGYKTGYWFWAGGKEKFSQASNFVIRPLFHVYSKMDNKRLVEINNGRYKSVLDLPSKALVGIQQFREMMYAEGNFRFDGQASHLNKIVAKISEQFPRCEELKTLGWQTEGFYAFSDGIFCGNWIPVDSHGVVVHNDKHFFLPAFSSIYSDVREEDDTYENDRWFKFHHNPKNNFEKWSKLMISAYSNKGMFGIAFFVASLFRDMIYAKYKIFPHLFLFGEKGSGKSQLGWSLNNVFWNGQPGFNLTAGTNVGFFRKLARARNSVTWYDEYNDYIDPKRFQALKSAYDGIGHEKGVMSRDNRTESTKVNSSCVISGQYLPTIDDNALFTRSLLLTFRKEDWQGNEDIMKAYSELKGLEETGLSAVIGDVVKFRDLMEKNYTHVFQQEFQKLKDELEDYNERILRNFATIISAVKCLQEVLKFPFSYDELFNQSKTMIIEQSAQISESEALSQFWNMIEFLFRDKRINYDDGKYKELDFKIEVTNHAKIMINRNEEKIHTFDLPTKCLFIRFTKVHPLYMEMHRKQHGHNGMAMSSLKTYIHGHKAFIGLTKATQFEDGVSSAYVFNFSGLGVNIERMSSGEYQSIVETNNNIIKEKQEDLPF